MSHQGRREFLKKSGLGLLPLAFGSVNTANTLSAPASNAPAKKGNASKTVLLRSSWNDYNIGDVGHTPGTLRLLEKYVPEASVTLWHSDARPITEALIKKNFPKVKIIT